MKRTKHINKARFRKHIVGLSVSIFLLAGCEQADQKVSTFMNIDQCVASGQSAGQCQISYNKAQSDAIKTAPKYQNNSDCQAEFNDCRYSSEHSSWYPLMMGYMMGPNGTSHPLYNNKGSFVDASGNNFGKSLNTTRMTTKSSLGAKPAVTKTTTRGGFGSSVSSRSSMGG